MSFIMMDNSFLINNDELNTFQKIGTEGFSIYCYLISQQAQKSYVQVNTKMIIDFMNREVKNSKKLNYGKKTCDINTMKSKKTIQKYLKVLRNNELIEYDEKNYKLNDFITIKVKTLVEENDFTVISDELFVDYIHKIGHVGWSLLYILTKLHNSDYGSISSEGFANPTEEYLKSIIKKDIKTIRAYLYLLQEYRLIKIEPQDPIYKGVDKNNIEVYEFLPNNYIVKNRLIDNKYYVEIISKKNKKV